MEPSYFLWGLFFLPRDLATLFLVQKGRGVALKKILFQEKKKTKWLNSSSFALMKVSVLIGGLTATGISWYTLVLYQDQEYVLAKQRGWIKNICR